MRLKICGVTNIKQAQAITDFGVDTIGFICVRKSPRYVSPSAINEIIKQLPPEISTIGVFVNETIENITQIVNETGLTGVQLHGEETPQFCSSLREIFPEIEIIKAIRYKDSGARQEAEIYLPVVDTLLIDTYQKDVYGGTGKTFPWSQMSDFRPSRPWLLAGGVGADNVVEAFETLTCDGLDISSSVEISPGQKDLTKIKELLGILESIKNKLPV
ncbi:MAG: phosphoribosylanthranilate isomerase [Cyanobacterium sp. T60_A2020_053]|nr:phosphoribosylanthranilate isomerase [Cyanobacterium sp. T60_A2020_053]